MHLCFCFFLAKVPPDGVPPFFCLGDRPGALEGSALCTSTLGLDDAKTLDSTWAGLGYLL